MNLQPIYPPFDKPFDKMTEEDIEDILNKLYEFFLKNLAESNLQWHNKPLIMRPEPSINGRHAIFYHIISDSYNGKYSKESNRSLSVERCARIHWIYPMIKQAESCFPRSENNNIHWWKSDRQGNSGTRYAIATKDYNYVVIIEEKKIETMLITAYYVEQNHRRTKLQKEHDRFWLRRRPT